MIINIAIEIETDGRIPSKELSKALDKVHTYLYKAIFTKYKCTRLSARIKRLNKIEKVW